MTLQALTANYNSAEYLAATLRSAVEDNRIPVLLVDDGSTDGSDRIAEGFPEVTVIRQTNAGPSVARNRAILESRAEFVLFLDSDDLLRPGYREAFEAALASHPDADVFVCGMEVVDEAGAALTRHDAPTLKPDPYRSVLRDPVPTNGIVVRRRLFHRVGLFDPAIRHAEDWDLWLRLAAVTDRWVRMDHHLAVYRLRGGSLSKDGEKMWEGIRTVIRRAWGRKNLAWPQRVRVLSSAYWRGARYSYATGCSAPIRRALQRGDLRLPARILLRHPVFWPHFAADGAAWLFRRAPTQRGKK